MNQLSGPTCGYRVVQVHPLLKCNLKCLHCYSSSGPQQRTSLNLDQLCLAVDVLQAEGFNAVGISGGEPLLYPQLPELLRYIREKGLISTVTTNGTLIDDSRAAMLSRLASVVAVSLDGMPESHNRMRGNRHAFEHMAAGVARLRNAKVPFGFIFTLSLHNLHELGWIADFAVAQRATLLQVHPLEEVGRAKSGSAGHAPDELELARAFIEVARLQKELASVINIQCDVADLEVLRGAPERVYAVASEGAACPTETTMGALSDLIAPIVLEADGTLVPVQHGFSRSYRIADLKNSSLSVQIQTWKRDGYHAFLELSNRVYDKILNSPASDYPFVNWYGQMLQASFESGDLSPSPQGPRTDQLHQACSSP